jgi:hypothetical protein
MIFIGRPTSREYLSDYMLDKLEALYPDAQVKGSVSGIEVVTLECDKLPNKIRGLTWEESSETTAK